VLVVDDSAVMRKLLPAALSRDPDIEVVATAVDGVAALRKLARFRPDVVTLDLEMPHMDGLEVLQAMVGQSETPVVVVSAHTQHDAALTATALSMGAVDVVAKPTDALRGGLEPMARELLAKLRAVAGRRWRRMAPAMPVARAHHAQPASDRAATRVVAIAASTGGPAALAYVLPRLPADLPAAVLVVQHMPEGFTEMLAGRLGQTCSLPVAEARDGERLRHGQVLIAPGGRHLRVRRAPGGVLTLVGRGAAVCGHRPSADVLLHSVASEFGAQCVGVILTGMGDDGVAGLLAVRRALGETLAQDEESSVVYGMPREALLRGAVERPTALDRIPEAITAAVRRQARRDSGPALAGAFRRAGGAP
jgi:two-component system chemotaxis response regulator CheB